MMEKISKDNKRFQTFQKMLQDAKRSWKISKGAERSQMTQKDLNYPKRLEKIQISQKNPKRFQTIQ